MNRSSFVFLPLQSVRSALTLATIPAPFFPSPSLEPKGFQPSDCPILRLVSENKSGFCPAAVPLLSRALSRWFVFVISGLGGLSRCPALISHICVRVYAQGEHAGHAGHRDISSFIINLYRYINNLYLSISVPQAVPLLSRSVPLHLKPLKLNKIMGRYCHGC